MVAVDDEGAWSVRTPLLPISVNGAGDVTAALFLAHSLTDGTRSALERTAASRVRRAGGDARGRPPRDRAGAGAGRDRRPRPSTFAATPLR
jgi:hypothetical protein